VKRKSTKTRKTKNRNCIKTGSTLYFISRNAFE